MHSKGCRWWCGELEKEEVQGKKVSARLWRGRTVSIVLNSKDELDIIIKDGKLTAASETRLVASPMLEDAR
jgi:hypothetical protein